MLELFTYDFMQRSLLAAAMVGGLCSVIGVFVVLRGLAFVGAGTSHAAFAGVALGYLMGWPPLGLAIIFGLATVWITGWVEEKGRMKLDVSIGILYTTTMALAILFIGLMKSYNAEVYGYLFGSVLSVTNEELSVIGGLSILVLGLIVLFSKELYFIAFDQEMAEASGVPARRMFFLLLTLVALTVVVSLKTVGAILVFAMILIQPHDAHPVFRHHRHYHGRSWSADLCDLGCAFRACDRPPRHGSLLHLGPVLSEKNETYCARSRTLDISLQPDCRALCTGTVSFTSH
jgi:ABC-type Mn2+/Zn2+ transport system permease subunit